MPAWIYDWADMRRFARIRTAVPFIVLSLLIGIWFCKMDASILQFIATWIIPTGVVVLAEFGQYFIPTRYVEPKDIFLGSRRKLFWSGIDLYTSPIPSIFQIIVQSIHKVPTRLVRGHQYQTGNTHAQESKELLGATLFFHEVQKKNRDPVLTTVRPVHDKKKLREIVRRVQK